MIGAEMADAGGWVALGGAGGNSTIIVGKTGVIVVDAKQTEPGAKDLLGQIATITPKPVKTGVTKAEADGIVAKFKDSGAEVEVK